jgi:hypothetical protein
MRPAILAFPAPGRKNYMRNFSYSIIKIAQYSIKSRSLHGAAMQMVRRRRKSQPIADARLVHDKIKANARKWAVGCTVGELRSSVSKNN